MNLGRVLLVLGWARLPAIFSEYFGSAELRFIRRTE